MNKYSKLYLFIFVLILFKLVVSCRVRFNKVLIGVLYELLPNQHRREHLQVVTPTKRNTMLANEDQPREQPPNQSHIDRVAVKPPPFWKTDPKIWFLQLEAQFELANITIDSTKFNYVVSAVDTEILTQVTDILTNPPASGRYLAIKERLINIYSDSSEQRLRRLLAGLELGDKRPSQLLNEMTSLGGTTVPKELLKTLWMQRLPTHIQSVLTTSSDEIDNLVKMADKIAEINQPSNFVAVTTSTASEDLAETVKQLARDVAELRTAFRPDRNDRAPRSKSRPRTRARSHSRQPTDGICWYHQTYKTEAKKCSAPCKYFFNASRASKDEPATQEN